MSSDYRPRGGSSSTGSGSGGSRRRRGGRGRSGGGGASGEHRSNGHQTNGTSSHSGPKKKVGPFAAFINWITGKKSTGASPAKSSRPNIVTTGGRPDSGRSENRERTPRAERTDRAERPERPERPQREERPQADPTPQEIVSPKLYVGNLAYEAGESDLFDLFSKVGAVKNVEIAMDRHANRSKGFGFVEMEALETAKEAAEKLNRTDFMGRQIVVSGAKVDRRPSNPREEATDSTPSSSEESNI